MMNRRSLLFRLLVAPLLTVVAGFIATALVHAVLATDGLSFGARVWAYAEHWGYFVLLFALLATLQLCYELYGVLSRRKGGGDSRR